jgi:tetratricopeptide (TPR) repeat protein
MPAPRTYFLLLLALLVVCFGLAARLEPRYQFMRLNQARNQWTMDLHGDLKPIRWSRASGDFFTVALGDSRRMFANEFFAKADEYYHSGYYPSIFDDNTAFQTPHMAEDTGAVSSKNRGDEHGFLGPTRNWIDAFGRHFFPDRHTHLDEGGADDLSGSDQVREILPWLKLSADLDPDNVQTYTVTAFWLRQRMNNAKEADAVLHEGLRNCPGSYDILFELGRLYHESYHDDTRARNVWEEAARQWEKTYPQLPPDEQKDSHLIMEQITTHLAKLDEDAGNFPGAVAWLQKAKTVSETPDVIQQNINRLQYKLGNEFMPELKPLY